VDDVASDPAVPVESVAARLPVSAPFSMPLPDAPPPSLQVTYYARVDCVVAGPGVLLNGTGTCSFTTLPPGETDALATSPGEKTFVIAQSAQTIDFPEFDVLYYGPGFVSLTAHASSGYRIRYQASGPCEIVRGAVKMLDNGFCTVTADQPGNWKFSPAPSVERTFQIYFPH
jgi:hypothetical protein